MISLSLPLSPLFLSFSSSPHCPSRSPPPPSLLTSPSLAFRFLLLPYSLPLLLSSPHSIPFASPPPSSLPFFSLYSPPLHLFSSLSLFLHTPLYTLPPLTGPDGIPRAVRSSSERSPGFLCFIRVSNSWERGREREKERERKEEREGEGERRRERK